MKTRKFFKVGLLLFVAGLGLTNCGKDDKDPEIVVDPVEETVEYYIAGKVVAEDAALSGVTVTAGDATATTDDKGQYTVTVKDKKTYAMSFAKNGYKSITDASVTIEANATNRSMATMNVTMNKEGVKVNVDPEIDQEISEKGEGEAEGSLVAIAIPAGAIAIATEVSVTPYVEAQSTTDETPGTSSEPVAMTNIVIASSEEVVLDKDITLAINNKASNESYFDEMEVYKKTEARASNNWEKLSNASFDTQTNSYKVTIGKGSTLGGEYSIRVKNDKTVSATKNDEINKEENKSNAGNMSAINNYSFSYEAKAGWDFVSPASGLESGMTDMINSTVAAQEGGAAGYYTVPQTVTTNISGDYILFYLSKAKYVEKTYTFYINGGKKATVTVKHYTGMEVTYTNQSSNIHSGGSIKQ